MTFEKLNVEIFREYVLDVVVALTADTNTDHTLLIAKGKKIAAELGSYDEV